MDDRWRATGLDEGEVADAIGFHLTPGDVERWAPFRPLEIHWATRNGLSLESARRWARHGVDVGDAIRAEAAGLTFDQLREWEREGFDVADAWEARETGLTIGQAVAWRAAGFVIPDALQLVRDGWTLPEAVVARVRHL
jgi:hypothetical protein